MAKKKKQANRRGYNKRSRAMHPGVSISVELRAGNRKVMVLRYKMPGATKNTKEVLKDRAGHNITTREKAEFAAIEKSEELDVEKARIAGGKRATRAAITWAHLQKKHVEYLVANGRAGKTVLNYEQVWIYLERWPDRPKRPFKLTLDDLQTFILFLRESRNTRTDKPLAPSTIENFARHTKAILNYGRKFLSCVRLDLEEVNTGLSTGRRVEKEPTHYASKQLVTVLGAATDSDSTRPPEQHVFPLLATFMLTGCRRGELENLRWNLSTPGAAESYVDFASERLVIFGKKTKRHRDLSFTIRPLLKRLLKKIQPAAGTKESPFVFGGKKALAIATKREGDTEGHRNRGRSHKATLAAVRKAVGGFLVLKDLRSTTATYLANSDLGRNLYQVANELGHDYAVLVKHYASHRKLPKKQASAETVSDLLGISTTIRNWLKEREDETNIVQLKAVRHG